MCVGYLASGGRLVNPAMPSGTACVLRGHNAAPGVIVSIDGCAGAGLCSGVLAELLCLGAAEGIGLAGSLEPPTR